MYNGNKLKKWHIKEWAIACSITGYLVACDVYPGASTLPEIKQKHLPDKVEYLVIF